MKKRSILTSALITVAGIIVVGCVQTTTNSSNHENPPTVNGIDGSAWNGTYHSMSGTVNKITDSCIIVTASKKKITASTECNGDTLTTVNDSVGYKQDTIRHFILDSKLIMGFETCFIETLTSGAKIYSGSIMTRVGSGSGIMGTWNCSTFFSWIALSGAPTQHESDSLNQYCNTLNQYCKVGIRYTITATSVSLQMAAVSDKIGYYCYMFNDTINGYAKYSDITAHKKSDRELTITGNKNHEVITMTTEFIPYNSNDASENMKDLIFTFSSTVVTHATSAYYSNPTKCPNNFYPVWFNEFLFENPKKTSLRTVPTTNMPHTLPAQTNLPFNF